MTDNHTTAKELYQAWQSAARKWERERQARQALIKKYPEYYSENTNEVVIIVCKQLAYEAFSDLAKRCPRVLLAGYALQIHWQPACTDQKYTALTWLYNHLPYERAAELIDRYDAIRTKAAWQNAYKDAKSSMADENRAAKISAIEDENGLYTTYAGGSYTLTAWDDMEGGYKLYFYKSNTDIPHAVEQVSDAEQLKSEIMKYQPNTEQWRFIKYDEQ